MIGRTRRQPSTTTTLPAVGKILDLMDYAQVPQMISVPHEIEHEIRLRPDNTFPRLIDVESLKSLVEGHDTEYVRSVDTTTTNRVRTTRQDDVVVENIYKDRVAVDDKSVILPNWNVRVATSIEYDMNYPTAYDYLDISREPGDIVITRNKERLVVVVGACNVVITQVRMEIRGQSRPPVVEFEIEVNPTAPRSERERCLDESIRLVDNIYENIKGLQRVITQWLGREWRGRFFGSLPVSYRNKHASTIRSNKYFVQAKIDGIRRIMVNLAGDKVWFIDRSRGIIASELPSFPSSNYMIDTEVVDDTVVAFDMLAEGSMNFMETNYSNRYNQLLSLLDQLDDHESAQDFITINTTVPVQNIDELVRLVRGESYDLYEDRTYEFTTDGFIFQHDGPYVSGRDPQVFKWKYPHLLTIDYLVNPQGLMINTPSGPIIFVEESQSSNLDQIVEFGYDKSSSSWIAQRTRPDKLVPNFVTTAMDTLESMIEDVTLHKLLSDIKSS